MSRCSVCGHEDMVHHMFAGCCHVKDCPCLGADGVREYCEPDVHAAEHNSFIPIPPPADKVEYIARLKGVTVTDKQRQRAIDLAGQGLGSRPISRELGLNRGIIVAILQTEYGPRPGTQPRTRPRRDDWARAMDAGITNAEYLAERHEAGRARTVQSLDEWIAERAASQAVSCAAG